MSKLTASSSKTLARSSRYGSLPVIKRARRIPSFHFCRQHAPQGKGWTKMTDVPCAHLVSTRTRKPSGSVTFAQRDITWRSMARSLVNRALLVTTNRVRSRVAAMSANRARLPTNSASAALQGVSYAKRANTPRNRHIRARIVLRDALVVPASRGSQTASSAALARGHSGDLLVVQA